MSSPSILNLADDSNQDASLQANLAEWTSESLWLSLQQRVQIVNEKVFASL